VPGSQEQSMTFSVAEKKAFVLSSDGESAVLHYIQLPQTRSLQWSFARQQDGSPTSNSNCSTKKFALSRPLLAWNIWKALLDDFITVDFDVSLPYCC